jgi:catechol 2,3-dioxygenase-like lactoylglutathione lyase family enzyme
MKFGYTIIYVSDVFASVTFFEQAFGLKRRFIHESGYAELDTGETALAFASHELGRSNLPEGYVRADKSEKPLGTEIALVTELVADAYARAIAAGAVSIKGPVEKPWGQTVAYVRCPDGILVEICSPMSSGTSE